MTAVILAGGSSRRFGSDKALARLPGDSWAFLDRVIGAARLPCAGIMIVGKERPTRWPGVQWVGDLWPDQGPLGGAISGLSAVSTMHAVLLAVDQPNIATSDIHDLGKTMFTSPSAYEVNGQIMTLPVALPVEPALRHFQKSWSAGERSLLRALKAAGLTTKPASGDQVRRLADFDRPGDLENRDEVTEG